MKFLRSPLEMSKRIAPDAVETRLAEGYFHYYGSREFDKALEQFRFAQKRRPNDADVLSAIGFIFRRKGKLEDAIQQFTKAAELNPRDSMPFQALGEVYFRIRQYDKADEGDSGP